MATLRRRVRFVALVVVITAAAAALGGGSGLLLSKAGGDEAGPVPALTDPASPAENAADEGARAATPGTASPRTGTVEISIRDGRIVRPSGSAGRALRRLSIRLTVAVRNTGRRDVELGRISLTRGSTTVRNDPRARDVAGGLIDPVPAGAAVTGELRFETTGARSEAFRIGESATLTIAGRSAVVRLRASDSDR